MRLPRIAFKIIFNKIFKLNASASCQWNFYHHFSKCIYLFKLFLISSSCGMCSFNQLNIFHTVSIIYYIMLKLILTNQSFGKDKEMIKHKIWCHIFLLSSNIFSCRILVKMSFLILTLKI